MKTVKHTETFDCELAGREVTLRWNILEYYQGVEAQPSRLGKRGCTGKGVGNCPVGAGAGIGDFFNCPRLAKYRP